MFNKLFKTMCITIALCLTACTFGCEEEQSDGKGYLFNYTMLQNPENLDPQIATDTNSITVIKNIFTGLMVEDQDGNLSYGMVKDYAVSDDGLRYVFYLRDDYQWYNANSEETSEVTAYDYVFAFQRLFNPEMYSPYGEKFACLKNGTKILNGDEDVSYTDLGVYASDKYTLTFLLDYPNSDFLRLLSESYAMPCNEEFFNGTHSTYGLYDTSTISNGAFYIKQWFYDRYGKDNFITLRRNPVNPRYDDYSPYAVQITIDENLDLSDVQHDFYKDGTDLYYSATLDKTSIDKDDVVNEYEVSTVGAIFNLEDDYFKNPTVANAFAYSIDREEAKRHASTDVDVAYGIVPSASKVDSSSYRELVPDVSLIDDTQVQQYYSTEFESAKEILETMPKVRVIIQSSGIDTSFVKSVTDSWAEQFGVTILMDTLNDEEFQKALEDGDYQVAIYDLTATDDRPYSFLSAFMSTSKVFNYSSLEVDTVLKASEQSLTTDDLVAKYSQVEKSILDDHYFVPLYYRKSYLICSNGTDKVNYNPFNYQLDFSYAVNYNQED